MLPTGTSIIRNPSSQIQTLTVKSDANLQQNEVQLVTAQLNLVEGTKQIQSFTTSAVEIAEL